MVIDIPKIIDSIKAHKNIVLFVASLVLAVAMITLIVIFCGPAPKAQTASHPASQFTPKATEAVSTREQATTAAKATEKQTEAPETTEAEQTTAEATTQPATAAPGDVVFATAEPAADPADYQAQWDAGYLVAIDNPDTSYACYHIDLTDEDRELLENLCYGEFGTGGFIGAALIAQAVKDAMCFDGYTTIPDVIKYCRYDGSTTSGTSDECRQAVRYIFDDDGSAVQHRILYMYAPYMVNSSFHESQNFILSYQQIRFFDRWGS